MTRRRRAVLAAGAVLVLGLGVLAVTRALDDGGSGRTQAGSPVSVVVSDESAAVAGFAPLTAGTIRVGGQAVKVVIADRVEERVQGLRGRPDPAPYEGMLFVFDEDSTAAFTMAGVPEPLAIAFFDARGRRVDELRMEPCAGTDATCPRYVASGPYRYTLETAPGAMPPGRLEVVAPDR